MMILRVFLAGALAALCTVDAWAACPPRILTRLGTEPVYRDRIVNYWKGVPPHSSLEQGLVVTLDLGGEKGVQHVSSIIETFVETSGEQFERIARLGRAGRIDQQISALASGDELRIWGVSAELRFADERIGASHTETFQQSIPGSVPDIVDTSGNLYEIKYRSWTNQTPADDIALDFRRILAQCEVQQEYAASHGKMFTLAFEVPVPQEHLDLFEEVFWGFSRRGNVAIIDGF